MVEINYYRITVETPEGDRTTEIVTNEIDIAEANEKRENIYGA